MARLIADCPASHWPAVEARLRIGLNHEQQHQELLVTDIKRHFAHNPLRPAYRADLPMSPIGDPEPLVWLPQEGGLSEIGAGGAGFHYDNESPRHRVFLEPFALADRPVTNGEFLALHPGRRLPEHRPLALRRLGRGPARTAGARRSTGRSAMAPGS